MPQVLVVFKVYPKDGELDKALAGINAQLKPKGTQTEEIGFGIKMIKVLFTFEDTQNSSSKLEEQLRSIEGVNEVEVAEEELL
jgi:translation elongation factor EF-1beta